MLALVSEGLGQKVDRKILFTLSQEDPEQKWPFATNRPFAGSGHMVRNKLHWDANDAVGLSKQRKVGLDW